MRLHNQQLSHHAFRRAEDVVDWLGAVQGQEYEPGKWAIGLRLPDATSVSIERAVVEKRILRTWPMRGTIHFVAATDAHWMVRLLAPRTIRKMASYYEKQKLDAATFAKSRRLLTAALHGGQRLDRPSLYAILERAGIRTTGSRGLFILGRLAMEGLLCFGPKSGNQPTFMLLDDAAPKPAGFVGTEALAELGRRYFTGHGPATAADLAWWAGLRLTDARKALELAAEDLTTTSVGGTTYAMSEDEDADPDTTGTFLLPTYDEFLIGYKDRSAAIERPVPLVRMFTSTIVSDGRVIGFWRRDPQKETVQVTVKVIQRGDAEQKAKIVDAVAAYARFLGRPVTIKWRSVR